MRKPFTDKEQEVMDHLVKAWNAYVQLPVCHPDELTEFRHAIHRLEDLMSTRVVRRDYPDNYVTVEPKPAG